MAFNMALHVVGLAVLCRARPTERPSGDKLAADFLLESGDVTRDILGACGLNRDVRRTPRNEAATRLDEDVFRLD